MDCTLRVIRLTRMCNLRENPHTHILEEEELHSHRENHEHTRREHSRSLRSQEAEDSILGNFSNNPTSSNTKQKSTDTAKRHYIKVQFTQRDSITAQN